MLALLEAGFSLVAKVWQTIADARQMADEKKEAIRTAFVAAEKSLDDAAAKAHAETRAEHDAAWAEIEKMSKPDESNGSK